jgi:predicted metal-dependent phosphotriesterase family hydrolase
VLDENAFWGSSSVSSGRIERPVAKVVTRRGFSEQDLNRMFKETPARLVGLLNGSK